MNALPIVTLPTEDLRKLMEAAAEEGARKALAAVGLHDEDAADDVRGLRDLMKAWRDTKSTVLRAVVQGLTMATLAALAIGAAFQIRGGR